MKRGIIALCGTWLAACAYPLNAGIDARMLRYPDVSATHITFVYAGDIWVVPKSGGVANRLSSPAGEEGSPRFSPDGSRIAFTGNYDGNADVYVVPTEGGPVQRLTFHPADDRVLDWDAAGTSVLFASMRESETDRYNRFFRVPAAGGLPVRLPIPYGESAMFSPDGEWIVYTPRSAVAGRWNTWKRYRGGMAADIWLFNLKTYESRKLTDTASGEELPMWHNRRIYFLSDRDSSERFNLWVQDLDTDATRQLTRFKDVDITTASIGPRDIVFEAGGRLHLFDLATEKHASVEIEIVTDLSTLRPRSAKVSDLIGSVSLSPSGKRIIAEARGDLFSIPRRDGPILNLTRSSGVAELFPAWSPDGRTVAYLTDRQGEYQLALLPADGAGEETILTSFPDGFRYQPYWSPDSRKLAFVDHTMSVQVHDLDRRQTMTVDQLRWLFHGDLLNFRVEWSPDSRWLAYDKQTDANHNAVFLFDTHSRERHQVTSGAYDDSSPVFDPEGDYLYFLTSRHFEPVYDDLQNTWVYINTMRIAAMPLRREVPSPLQPRNDEEEIRDSEEKTKPGEKEGKPDESSREEKKKSVEIHLADIERRVVILPPRAGRYSNLAAAKKRVIYLRQPNKGSAERESALHYFDLEAREEKTILNDAGPFQLARDGSKALVRRRREWALVDVKPDQKFEKPLPTGDLEMTVHPREEWRQIFNDAWRFYRDYFYDPSHHGVDWAAIRARCGGMLNDAITRWDVNIVIGEMIGELNASHTYRSGGDLEAVPSRPVGLLGVDLALEQGGYRIARILRGAPWDSEVRSPLDDPTVGVRVGDFLLAVNGVPLEANRSPWFAFEGLAGKVVRLTINDRPAFEGSRPVLVKTLTVGEERRLRRLAWIETNRVRVDEATEGRVGYIHVPDTAVNGQTELFRQFRAQINREGLIIDERFNSGGQLGDRFLELLGRRPFTYLASRYGPDQQWPPVGHFGPQVMLINGWSGSGGDAFPWFFRTANRGPIIGKRTWGGLIGPAVPHRLIDGGTVVVPPSRLYGPDGKWFAEGHGVDPDIEVDEDPTALARGTDAQLERAIAEIRERLRENPPLSPARPVYEFRGWPRGE